MTQLSDPNAGLRQSMQIGTEEQTTIPPENRGLMEAMRADRAAAEPDARVESLRRRHPEMVGHMTDDQVLEFERFMQNNPFGTIRSAPPESTWTSMYMHVPRMAAGFQRGVFVEPARQLSNAFGALSDFAGNERLGDAFRATGARIMNEDQAQLAALDPNLDAPGTLSFATGEFLGNLAPSMIGMYATGGASGGVLLFYGIQAFGGGAEDYREQMLARGLQPDAVEQFTAAVGNGLAEVVSEKLGLDLIGKVGIKQARRIGDAMLKGKTGEAAGLLTATVGGGAIEGIEEAISQVSSNAIAGNGFWFMPGYDPERPISRDVLMAMGMGSVAGTGMGFVSAFSHPAQAARGRVQPVEGVEAIPVQDAIEEAGEAEVTPQEAQAQADAIVEAEVPNLPAVADEAVEFAQEMVDTQQTDTGESLDAEAVSVAEAIIGAAQRVDRPRERVPRDRRTSQANTVKGRIRDLVMGRGDERMIKERTALRRLFQRMQATAREAARAERQEQHQVARVKLDELRDRMAKQRLDADNARRTLRQIVQENLPAEIQGEMLTAVEKANTVRAIAKGIARAQRLLNRFETKQARRDLKSAIRALDVSKMTPDAQEAVIEAVGDIELGKSESKALRAAARVLANNPNSPFNAEDFLDLTGELKIENMTKEQARLATMMIQASVALNQQQQRARVLGRNLEQGQINDAIAGEVTSVGGDRAIVRDIENEIVEPPSPSRIAKVFRIIGFGKPDLVAEVISGSDTTVTHQTTYQNLTAAQTEALRQEQAMVDELLVALRAAGINPNSRRLAQMSDTIAEAHGWLRSGLEGLRRLSSRGRGRIRFPRTDAKAPRHEITLESGVTVKLTEAQRMGLYLTLRDPDTRQQVIEGGVSIRMATWTTGDAVKITEADVSTLVSQMSQQELDLAEAMLRIVNTTGRDLIREWSIEQMGFDITSPDAWWTRHRAGAADPRESITGGQFGSMSANTAGIVKQRIGGKQAIEIKDAFAEFNNIVHTTAWLTQVGPAFTVARRAMNNPGVKTALAKSFGAEYITYFNRWLDQIAKQAVGGPTYNFQGIAGTAVRLMNRMQIGVLGLHIPVGLYQVGSGITAAAFMDPIAIGRKMASNLLIVPMLRAQKRMKEQSPDMRARLEASAQNLVAESTAGSSGLNIAGKIKRLDQMFMWLIHTMDSYTITAIWRAAESKAGGDAELAQKIALGVIRRTQPMFDVMHLSGIGVDARSDALTNVSTRFFSQRNQNMNIVTREVIRTARNPRHLPTAARVIGMTALGQVAWLMFIKWLRRWLVERLAGRELEDSPDKFAAEALSIVSGNLYFGDAITSMANTILFPEVQVFEPELSPIVGLFNDTFGSIRALKDNINGTDPEYWDDVSRIFEAVGPFWGIPTPFPLRTMRKIISEEEGGRSRRSAI